MTKHAKTYSDVVAFNQAYDLTAKQEGWMLTNDSEDKIRIARLDDPQAWIDDGWPLSFNEPLFDSDDSAIAFVQRLAQIGSYLHTEALVIHQSNIPLPPLAEQSPAKPRDSDELIGAIEDAISDLCSGNYDDGTHPLVNRVINDLRETIGDPWQEESDEEGVEDDDTCDVCGGVEYDCGCYRPRDKSELPDVPADFPVKVLGPNDEAKDRMTCGTCGRSWDDAIPTQWTPVPSARCPFEYFH